MSSLAGTIKAGHMLTVGGGGKKPVQLSPLCYQSSTGQGGVVGEQVEELVLGEVPAEEEAGSRWERQRAEGWAAVPVE